MLAWNEIVIRLVLASFFGALIGLERERKNWTAGMRTHMMVCVGAALIMIVSAFGFSDIINHEHISLDPSRIAAQVVSGIGFIGAGTIMFMKQGTIRGLTTASGLWTVAAIGLATGGGMYFAAGATTLLAFIILWALQPLERKFTHKFKQKTLTIVTQSSCNISDLMKKIESVKGVHFLGFSMEKIDGKNNLELKFEEMDTTKLSTIITEFAQNTEVEELYWDK